MKWVPGHVQCAGVLCPISLPACSIALRRFRSARAKALPCVFRSENVPRLVRPAVRHQPVPL